MYATMQSLWIGPELSMMEQVAIRSFLHHGHPFHLYVYDTVRNVPPGTVLQDASEILPPSAIFQDLRHKSYGAFSDFFRFKLLWERGGWWTDTDFVCLRPLDFPAPYVFSSEIARDGSDINCGLIKAPAGSEILGRAWQRCQEWEAPQEMKWGQCGPDLLAALVEEFSFQHWVMPFDVFCPIPPKRWADVLDPAIAWDLPQATYGIHLWNELWRRKNQDKNQRYPSGCLYEQLKRRYL